VLNICIFYDNRRGCSPYWAFIEKEMVLTECNQETKKEIKKINKITHKLLAIE